VPRKRPRAVTSSFATHTMGSAGNGGDRGRLPGSRWGSILSGGQGEDPCEECAGRGSGCDQIRPRGELNMPDLQWFWPRKEYASQPSPLPAFSARWRSGFCRLRQVEECRIEACICAPVGSDRTPRRRSIHLRKSIGSAAFLSRSGAACGCLAGTCFLWMTPSMWQRETA